jgi:choline dehydrogenase
MQSVDADEVVLCAGAIGSPHLLMLSGIGDPAVLGEFGIDVVSALPGVGQNFQDDLFVTVGYATSQPMPPQPYGLMGAVVFTNDEMTTRAAPTYTNIECSLAAGTMAGLQAPADSFWIYPNVQLLQSRGTVTLQSTDFRVAPRVDPEYLSVPEDLARCADAIWIARQIGSQAALRDWEPEELLPGPNVTSPSQLAAYVQATAGTCFHFAGTCQMGTGPNAVVDPLTLNVRGTDNLCVIDASIIPTTVSGNTAAATMMIADKGADAVLVDAERRGRRSARS